MEQSSCVRPTFTEWALDNKRVLLRVDANVPLCNGVIENDVRLQALRPTLDVLQQKNAHVTLATHIGRPQGYDAQLSTASIAAWCARHGYQVHCLENLRFDVREHAGDETYARELAAGHDYFISDAWGALHRTDTSIAVLPYQFAPEYRSVGLLVESEYTALMAFGERSKTQSTIFFLGGAKMATKLPLMQNLIERFPKATFVVLPPLSGPFLRARGLCAGDAKITIDLDFLAKKISDYVLQKSLALILPVDVLVMSKKKYAQHERALCEVLVTEIADGDMVLSVGKKSLAVYQSLIANAQAILYNGAMGFSEIPESKERAEQMLRMIAERDVPSVIAGGDTSADAGRLHVCSTHLFCSTGGGATLAFLAGKELPGLTPFLKTFC